MAAVTRERNERPYEDGGGYGKFPKRPFRRSTQTTPYDRPATAIRNPSGSGNEENRRVMDKQKGTFSTVHNITRREICRIKERSDGGEMGVVNCVFLFFPYECGISYLEIF
ncbi:hypothetical protein NC653_026423 [Populus alba x Populus x berolinensis]|uniref:Uncharacterized protein n=1 Tax=Populus alba x Populus x berolinensis TaxID=444605 RepID=A0AAD6MDQ5_9ROSI|nr:hypothetical protein NC653_026423 [Populus alba x Populus x berolinensis]